MKKLFFISIFVFSLFVYSCVTYNSVHRELISEIKNGNYEYAYRSLEAAAPEIYPETDKLLLNLDLGVLAHYSGNDDDSISYLNQAENLIWKNYSKSISQNISSFIVNDNVIDYPGEDYEDIYVNLFKALSYISKNDDEEAFVEIRRFDNKLKSLTVKYKDKINEVKNENHLEDNSEYEKDIEFHNSAFARYLSMLLYLNDNDFSSAEVDLKYIKSAFNTQKNIYDFSYPKNIEDNFIVPEDKVRLNVVSFTGTAPLKQEELIYNHYTGFKLALPVMYSNDSNVRYIKLKIKDVNGNTIQVSDFDKIESITNIAMETFKIHQSLIYFKSLARSLIKNATALGLDIASDLTYDESGDVSLVLGLLSNVSHIVNFATEQADLRTSRYFPGEVFVTGVNLNPGIYNIEVQYFSRNKNLIHVELIDNYEITENKLNLVESVCLK